MYDRVWFGHLATMADEGLGIVEDGAVASIGDAIAWVGPRAELPGPAHETLETGGWILPGLIDCHTHLVFGGDRSAEFERRLGGTSYEQIAREGGGILSTVRATRAASEDALVTAALPRLDALLAEGVTTIEIKSGYGLNLETEAAMLRAARRLSEQRAVTVRTSLLAAHAVPPGMTQCDYIRQVIEVILPGAAPLADAVDAFCDRIGFTPAETGAVFDAARALGLRVKLHADQLCDLGGAALAARHGALSADHLEYGNPAGLAAMAAAGTVAVLLPGAGYFIRETHHPDIAAMRAAGVAMALASDINPGSCPARSLLLMLNLGCTLYRLTVPEALRGVTRHAATALGLADRGVLAPGLRCDLAFFAVSRPAELCYWIGGNACTGRVVAGRPA